MEKVTITTTLTKELFIPKIRKGYTALKCENMDCKDLRCERCIYENENKVFKTEYLKIKKA